MRIRPDMDLDGAAERFVDDAIGDGDVLRATAAEPEDRPACAEFTIGDGNILATAEQSAGIVLAFDRAITDMHVRRADEMEPVIIAVHTGDQADAVEPGVMALD